MPHDRPVRRKDLWSRIGAWMFSKRVPYEESDPSKDTNTNSANRQPLTNGENHKNHKNHKPDHTSQHHSDATGGVNGRPEQGEIPPFFPISTWTTQLWENCLDTSSYVATGLCIGTSLTNATTLRALEGSARLLLTNGLHTTTKVLTDRSKLIQGASVGPFSLLLLAFCVWYLFKKCVCKRHFSSSYSSSSSSFKT